jgi:hypothetical protein
VEHASHRATAATQLDEHRDRTCDASAVGDLLDPSAAWQELTANRMSPADGAAILEHPDAEASGSERLGDVAEVRDSELE